MLYAISFKKLKFVDIANMEVSADNCGVQRFCCNLSKREVAFFLEEEIKQQVIPAGLSLAGEDYKEICYSIRIGYESALKSSIEKNDTIFYYNRDEGKLTIFRDNFGVVPVFYYYIPGELLIVSDSIRDLVYHLKQNHKRVEVNEEKLRAYLETGIINTPYTSETFFAGVKSVLPGYRVYFTSKEKVEKRLLSFDVSQWKKSCSDINDFGSEFKRLFGEAVAQSIEGKRKVGVTLSGGLDSSSVLSMVRFLSPETSVASFFVLNPRDPDIELDKDNDDFYSSEIAKHIGTEHRVISRRAESLGDIERALKLIYQPPLMMGSYTPFFDMFRAIKESEIDVLITGNDGDTIVGFGREYLTTLFRSREWEKLSAILSNHPRSKKDPRFREVAAPEFIYNELRSLFFSGNFCHASRFFFESCKHLEVSWITIIKLSLKRGVGKLMPSFNRGRRILPGKTVRQKESLDKNDLISTLSDIQPDQQAYSARVLNNHNIRLVEEYYALSRSFNVNVRFPFFSKELYELCLAVPDELNYFGGFGRGAMRHGLKGILLDSVRLRTNKSVGNGERMRENALSLIAQAEEYLKADNPVWRFVNRRNYLYNLELVKKHRIDSRYLAVQLFQLSRVIYTAIWLTIVDADLKSEEVGHP